MSWNSVVYPVIVAFAVLVAAPSSAAEAEPSKEQRQQAAELKIEELKERLKLTPEQEQRLAPLVQDRNAKLKALRERSGDAPSRRERRAMLKEARGIQENFIEQVEPVLTKEQLKEWEAIRTELRETARERMRERQ